MPILPDQIKAAYERDQRERKVVTRADDLPISYESITNEWLTSILCSKVNGAAVQAHSLGPPDTGTSNRRRIVLKYNKTGMETGLPPTVFCKASHDLANRMILGLSGAAHSEAYFYNELRPLLDIEAPRAYFAKWDPRSFNSMIMLADLGSGRVRFCSQHTHITLARVRSQLALLATVHGTFYRSEDLRRKLSGLPTWPDYFGDTLALGMKEGSSQGFLAAKDVIPPCLYARFDDIWPATVTSVEAHAHLPHTLAHGDVHLKNWYVADNEEMGLSDWQCSARGHWGRDLAYTIATALTIEDRRAWEIDLLKFYLDHLQSVCGQVVDFDSAWRNYRQQLMSALTWWTITLVPAPGMPDMQPRDLTLEFIRRIATAIDDLDALRSF
jgi:hypothetical protein